MTKNENWIDLVSMDQLNAIDSESQDQYVLIFKHSTSCSISAMAWNRFNRGMSSERPDNLKFYYLDLLRHRDISNEIAEKYNVRHESPQILVIFKNQCVHKASHMGISYSGLKEISNSN